MCFNFSTIFCQIWFFIFHPFKIFDPNSTYTPTEGLVCHGHAKAPPRCRLCGADLFARVGRLPCGPTERYLQGRPSSLCFCLILWEPPPISISIYYILYNIIYTTYTYIYIYNIGSISFRFSFLSISDAFISIYDVIIDIVSGHIRSIHCNLWFTYTGCIPRESKSLAPKHLPSGELT